MKKQHDSAKGEYYADNLGCYLNLTKEILKSNQGDLTPSPRSERFRYEENNDNQIKIWTKILKFRSVAHSMNKWRNQNYKTLLKFINQLAWFLYFINL